MTAMSPDLLWMEEERKGEERRSEGNEKKTLRGYQWSGNDFVEVGHHLVHEWVSGGDGKSY
ncbi:hypothetical protein SLEP1_g56230 [Rubroshorea leprosula]|uniref:Uncharacterized protein n=1 Tax=Rubroshorea leprosula TaxID=152421 RepID=A0AAV5MKE4_9ROSI|nr:hypothetical protein SLEP1_g56230 [Rubroshorea leprosula]